MENNLLTGAALFLLSVGSNGLELSSGRAKTWTLKSRVPGVLADFGNPLFKG